MILEERGDVWEYSLTGGYANLLDSVFHPSNNWTQTVAVLFIDTLKYSTGTISVFTLMSEGSFSGLKLVLNP